MQPNYGINFIQFGFSTPGMGELVLVLIIILVLFGGSKIPGMARNLGKGIKEFKKGLQNDSDSKDDDHSTPDK